MLRHGVLVYYPYVKIRILNMLGRVGKSRLSRIRVLIFPLERSFQQHFGVFQKFSRLSDTSKWHTKSAYAGNQLFKEGSQLGDKMPLRGKTERHKADVGDMQIPAPRFPDAFDLPATPTYHMFNATDRVF